MDTKRSEGIPKRVFSAEERKRWFRGINVIYDEMKRRSEKGPYKVIIGGLSFIIHPEVYAPQLFSDTLFFFRELPGLVGNKSLLEIGTGTGILGIACALKGASVVMTDINPHAVMNARENVKRHGLDITVREGSIYEPLKMGERFDCIFWAHPYNNWGKPVRDMLLKSGFDHDYQGLKSYIRGAREHLSRDGRLLLGTGDSADIGTIERVANDNGYSIEVLRKSRARLGKGSGSEITNMLLQFNPV
jgi:release factor glutamine methyltransferase